MGLYWPATKAVVADITSPSNRREAFAITGLADNLGLGVGIALAGMLVTTTGNYRLLFVIDAICFIVFFAVVYVTITGSSLIRVKQEIQIGQFAPFLVYVTHR